MNYPKVFPGNSTFFTSDTHFFHKNILKYCHRPWESVEEMNEALINNWNTVVKENDTVFHLGDIGFGNISKLKEILNRLNGNIYLIRGNHDYSFRNLDRFVDIVDQMRIVVDDTIYILNHFPFVDYNTHNIIQLCGHIHSGPYKPATCLNPLLQYDVGVDNNNYKPINANYIKQCLLESQERSKMEKLQLPT